MDDVRVMTEHFQKANEKVSALEAELAKQTARVQELEARLTEREARAVFTPASAAAKPAAPALDASPATSEPELEETLKRLVTKIAMILQAEKCVFLLHDKKAGELCAHRPAFGINDDAMDALRVRDDQGISGAVFQAGKPLLIADVANEEHAEKWLKLYLGAHNCASIPLAVEQRDEENRVTNRRNIGVLHVINKRYGGGFAAEDLHLLGVLSRNAAAVIANAKMFFEAVEEKNKMEATLESLTAGLILVGSNGNILLMNPTAALMVGVDAREATGQPYETVIAEERVKEMLRQALAADREVARAEIVLTRTDPESGEAHENYYQAQTALVNSAESGAMMGAALVLNDITEIRNVERMKSAFIATISHELNTPLTSIKGFISTLRADQDDCYDQHRRQEFYEIIDCECDRLSRLINNMISLSRIDAGDEVELKLQSVDLGALVESVVNRMRPFAASHQLTVCVAEGIAPVQADPERLEQILLNLVSNAIKYSPHGGAVTAEVEPADGGVRVKVSDQGIGISRENLAKIFDCFYRVDNSDTRDTYGTGIGLYLVKYLVEAHDGSICVESEAGEGSTFSFCLPLQGPQQGA
ncbi:MAG TPA: ATP-binding protein [Armatimonadota bacterium]|nr:ATP-binding protein [Armatimonadota bacterium]